MSELHDAVNALIQPTKQRVTHDDGTTTWHAVPSLWDQLLQSSGWGSGQASTKRNGGRPPISTGIVDIINDITVAATETTTDLLDGQPDHIRGKYRTTPDRLRLIGIGLPDQDRTDWWITNLRTWTAQARDQLGLNPPTARNARQATCPNCGEHTTYVKTAPKEYIRQPALAIIWDQPEGDDYHPDTDWRVGAVECRSCQTTWKRGSDLHLLYDQMLTANTTVETLAISVE